jgi:uncharacterized protein YxjI
MNDPNFLFEINDIVMKKKILSVREHYDFEDVNGAKLGEVDGTLLQFPPKFVIIDNHGSELMHLEGKMLSFRNQFTFYDNDGAELGTLKKKIVKLIGEEYWVEKNGLNSCVYTEISLNTITGWKSTAFQLLLYTRNGSHCEIK